MYAYRISSTGMKRPVPAIISRGNASVFVTRPISATLLVASAIILAVVLLPAVRRKRDEVFVEED